jgi:4-hydroxybutyrate CoA-transferase
MGAKPLYDAVNGNPRVTMDSMEVVNDPALIAKQKHMTAINTALEVDILGNVNAERIGQKIISAPGGQPNFMEGASSSKDGRSIMALRSLTRDGKSTIVLALNGPVVTTPSNHVDHVVTEWGATPKLRGMATDKRTYQIISVAHPLYRKALADTALERKIIDRTQHDKLVRSVPHAIERADASTRRALADQALEKGVIDSASHARALAGLPAEPAAAQ